MSEFNVYLLRHGELVKKNILCGRTDIALSEIGKQQLITATHKLPDIAYCYSSPLIRCQEFAEQYCQQKGLTLQVVAQLKEMNFGDWDGKSYQTLWQKQPKLSENGQTLGEFWQNPWHCTPPNGESMASFTARVDSFWQNLLLTMGKNVTENTVAKTASKNVLVISHGGVIRHLLAKVLALPIPGTTHMTQINVPYGSLIQIRVFIDHEGKTWPQLML